MTRSVTVKGVTEKLMPAEMPKSRSRVRSGELGAKAMTGQACAAAMAAASRTWSKCWWVSRRASSLMDWAASQAAKPSGASMAMARSWDWTSQPLVWAIPPVKWDNVSI